MPTKSGSKSGSRSSSRASSRGKSGSQKSTAKAGARGRGSGKRELLAPRGDKRFARRDGQGRIKESDDVGKSLGQDRRRSAKARAKPGQGDRGDR